MFKILFRNLLSALCFEYFCSVLKLTFKLQNETFFWGNWAKNSVEIGGNGDNSVEKTYFMQNSRPRPTCFVGRPIICLETGQFQQNSCWKCVVMPFQIFYWHIYARGAPTHPPLLFFGLHCQKEDCLHPKKVASIFNYPSSLSPTLSSTSLIELAFIIYIEDQRGDILKEMDELREKQELERKERSYKYWAKYIDIPPSTHQTKPRNSIRTKF